MATIITVPHRTNAGGISPKRLRTFSERNSISLDFFFSPLLFLFFDTTYIKFLASKFKLILDQIVVCTSLFYKRCVVASFNYFTSIDNNYLICVFNCR